MVHTEAGEIMIRMQASFKKDTKITDRLFNKCFTGRISVESKSGN